MKSHLVRLQGLHIIHVVGVDILMLLIKAYITDPIFVFLRTLMVNLYLTFFIYINFIIRNLGINMNNKFRKRKPFIIIKESLMALVAISLPIMLYYIL